ncbi:MAG: ATP-binding cassette domain-containing protein [Candidatus Thorarchaeota archaeon]
MLEVRDVSFSYDNENTILDSVNLQIRRGEISVITGPTGSGKSTLALVLAGFIPRVIEGTFTGSLLIDGENVARNPISEIARKVALVQQDPESQISTLLVSDEVAFGPENYSLESSEIQKRVEVALNAVESSHLANRPTYALSGGEKQRITIASMLSGKPNFLLLDEPSASLDPKGIQQLRKTLLGLKNTGYGILCIEHRLETILPIADRVLQLSESEISKWSGKTSSMVTTPVEHLQRPDSAEPLLIAKGVSYSYGTINAVRNVTLSVYPGEIIALMGDNGSGKSTLVSLLAGLLHSTVGATYIDGVPSIEMTAQDVAARVAVVFQNPNHQIFERTVQREQYLVFDVVDSLDEFPSERVEEVLLTAGLADLKERNPFSLSHGQKRRLNVSSVTVHEPLVYLFDEPFIGQDERGRSFITQTIRKQSESGGAAILVTHDSAVATSLCNRIIFMERGSVLLDGAPKTVLDRLREIGYSEYADLGVIS